MHTTYSFSDVEAIISHPGVGQYSMQGEGIGSITVSMSGDLTSHDVAADGVVMVSKIDQTNGTITINAQQTSSLHRWLLKYTNYVKSADTSEWAEGSITIRAPYMKETLIATGVSPQKLPDKPYQQQGQQVAWTLMAAKIQQLPY